MLVTALNKQRHSRLMAISFAGDLEQLTTYEMGESFEQKQKENFTPIEDLLLELKNGSSQEPEPTAYIFNGIGPDRVCMFISEFHHSKEPAHGTQRASANTLQRWLKEVS